eukprot:TRINITY_DN438_c0_g1_i1.p1 TRINITY_DN438_c0_g1~~TRINITY_DN438_c0_g1_i1.p1  ORF type:complete len:1370 (-),score=126.39 TRINITY_DN438_c0_g1_i1:2818-6927(-)
MGCGCATVQSKKGIRAGSVRSKLGSLNSTRTTYFLLKRSQLKNFLSHLIPKEFSTKLNELANALAHDCQGISSTSESSEIDLLTASVAVILSFSNPPPTLVKAAMDFLAETVTFYKSHTKQRNSNSSLENQFGRYSLKSSVLLLKDISEIPVDKLAAASQGNPQVLTDFLFCILGVFRYSAGLNFRASMRLDESKLKYLQGIYFKLAELQEKLFDEELCDAKMYTKRDYSGVATIEDLAKIQNEKIESKCRKEFDSFLRAFVQEVPNNSFFEGDPRTYIQEMLASHSTPQILALVKSSHMTRLDLFLDDLYANPECNHFQSIAPSFPNGPGGHLHKYQIVGRHYCQRKNLLTLLPRYILLHLILSLVNHSSKIRKYLACIEYSVDPILRPRNKLVPKIYKVLHEFFVKIGPVNLKHTLVFIIDNADYLDDSFYFALKYCKKVMPTWLKIVVTVSGSEGSRLKMLGPHNLVVSHGNFMSALCGYLVNKVLGEGKEELAIELVRRCVDGGLAKFKEIWKALKKVHPEAKLANEDVLELCESATLFGVEKKRAKIQTVIKEIKSYKHFETVEKVLVFLMSARSPLPIVLLEEWLSLTPTRIIQETLKSFAHVFHMNEPVPSPETIIYLKHKSIWQQFWHPSKPDILVSSITEMNERCWSSLDNESMIELPEYYRLNAVHHYTKIMKPDTPVPGIRFAHPDWIYSQLSYFKSFDFILSDLDALHSAHPDSDLVRLRNHLHLLEQTYENAELPLSDFAAHIRSRLMNEESLLLQNCMAKLNELSCPHFKPSFPTLRENNNISFIGDSDSEVVAVLMEANNLIWATSLGMLYVFAMPEYKLVQKNYIEFGIDAVCYAGDSRILIASGKYLYLWRIESSDTKNPEFSLESPQGGTTFLTILGTNFYAVGKDNSISKGTVNSTGLTLEKKTAKFDKPITAFLAVNNPRGEGIRSTLIFTGHASGIVKIFGVDLHWLVNLQHGDDKILSLQPSSLKGHVISLCSDGGVKIFDMNYYTTVSDLSIFDVAQDNLVGALFVESAGILVAVETHLIRFYKISSCSLHETWHHPFSSPIKALQKTKDDKFLLVGDEAGHVVVFNIQKTLEQRVALGMPSHRPESPVNFLLCTTNLSGEQHLVSCSGEREVKIWGRDTGRFIKKYSLSAVARKILQYVQSIEDIITAAELDKEKQHIGYFGCKDTNIYQIDLTQGIATEPFSEQHGTQNPQKLLAKISFLKATEGLLICGSEKNVKVWNTKTRMVISDFTEHKGKLNKYKDYIAAVLYASFASTPTDHIESIDAGFNYMKWHFITKEVMTNIPLLLQDASYIEEEIGMVAVFCDQKCYIGTTAGLVRCFCLKTKQELFKISTFNSISFSIEVLR